MNHQVNNVSFTLSWPSHNKEDVLCRFHHQEYNIDNKNSDGSKKCVLVPLLQRTYVIFFAALHSTKNQHEAANMEIADGESY